MTTWLPERCTSFLRHFLCNSFNTLRKKTPSCLHPVQQEPASADECTVHLGFFFIWSQCLVPHYAIRIKTDLTRSFSHAFQFTSYSELYLFEIFLYNRFTFPSETTVVHRLMHSIFSSAPLRVFCSALNPKVLHRTSSLSVGREPSLVFEDLFRCLVFNQSVSVGHYSTLSWR